jgi:hypothetical protein
VSSTPWRRADAPAVFASIAGAVLLVTRSAARAEHLVTSAVTVAYDADWHQMPESRAGRGWARGEGQPADAVRLGGARMMLPHAAVNTTNDL